MKNWKPTVATALALAALGIDRRRRRRSRSRRCRQPATHDANGSNAANAGGMQVVTVPSAGSPLVAIRLLFDAGSIYDPAGKEGLASLTAMMIGQSGTAKRSYKDLVEALYPMAASVDSNTDREVTAISGRIHRDKLADYTALLEEAVLAPGFAQSDFERNKEQLVAYLTTTLRASDDESWGSKRSRTRSSPITPTATPRPARSRV